MYKKIQHVKQPVIPDKTAVMLWGEEEDSLIKKFFTYQMGLTPCGRYTAAGKIGQTQL